MLSEANYKELLRYRGSPVSVSEAGLSARETQLLENKYIEPAEYRKEQFDGVIFLTDVISYRITPEGEDALKVFEDICNEHAQNERQRRFENKIAVANMLVPAITFILGMIVEHLSGIISWLTAIPQ